MEKTLSVAMKKYLKKLKKYWPLLVLVLPAFIYVLIFSYQPMYGIIIAFAQR